MYQTIIMPVDVFEMELSDKAVRHAEFLAQDTGVIHLLLRSACFFQPQPAPIRCRYTSFEEHLQHEAQTRLTTMISHFSISPERIHTHVRLGSVRDVVNEMAEELHADMVGDWFTQPFYHYPFAGSNASSVVRHAHIPVLVVR